MKKMNHNQRFNLLSGMVLMLAHTHFLAKENGRAKCIYDAYFGKDKDSHWMRLMNNLDAHGKRAPEAIIVALMRKHCG